ncbi:MAG: PQQ-dependent sugar dehydrogenase [Acidobacteriota bacterium]
MRPLLAKSALALSSSVAFALFLGFTAYSGGLTLRAQDAKGDAKGGAAKAKGKGPVDTLGEGPWDLKSEVQNIHVSVVTKGLDHPWGMVFLPNGDMLVTERPGRLRVVRKGVLDPTPIAGLPDIRALSLGGLMDVALHPNYARNNLIYFTYSKPGYEDKGKAMLAVGRAKWDGGPAISEFKDIYLADAWGGQGSAKGCCGQGPSDASYGSRIVFDRAGLLYVTSGDRNFGEKAQDPSTDIGKILRLKEDGTVPTDNPFVGKAGYKPSIYTLGNRNPLGLTVHPVTGEIWESEFGPRGGDEVNRIQAGKNYGWLKVTRGEHYNAEPSLKTNTAEGMVDAVLFWVPSINPGNIAFYNGDKFPDWRGSLLMGTMTKSVMRATFDAQGNPTGQERFLTELNQRFRDTRVGPDGLVYILTDETFGAILKLEPGK